ncbi:MAG: tail fiber domain-containing protein, partial [Alphaproteobacteria bacterium]|nr:tail fiber domain-containing protein [Alphaproteobacteria bacterium]
KVDYDATACAVGIQGAIRYDSSGSALSFCDGTTWQTLSSGGAATPYGADTQIQYNSNGSLWSAANLVYTSTGDFIVGSYQLDDTGTGNEDYRMFFDRSKGALRAGYADGTQWNDSNIGVGSFALGRWNQASAADSIAIGRDTVASGSSSVAIGNNAQSTAGGAIGLGTSVTASGNYSKAIGYSLGATGEYSTAIGRSVKAGNGTAFNGLGDGSMAVGLIDDAVTITTPSQVTGIQSMGIFMGDQDGGVDLSDANTLGLFGGKMVIDPNVPATNLSADTALEVDGTIKMAYGGEACDASREGAIHYNSSDNKFYLCKTAGAWDEITTGTPSAAAPDRGIQFNSGGNFAAEANFTYTSAGDFIVGSYQLDDTGTGNEDRRMFFDKSKAAFRAGRVIGTEWDDANVGNESIALGTATTASGAQSVAIGANAQATQISSIAMGWNAQATHNNAMALGWNAAASGLNSTALGNSAAASGTNAVAIGDNNTASGEDSTAMGVGSTASGDYSTAMGSTTTASGAVSFAMGRSVIAGSGTAGDGTGDGSLAIGLIDDTTIVSTPPQVTGIQSMGIFMGDQDGGVVFASSSTLGLFGGRMILDPNVPATQLATSTGGEQDLEMDITGDLGAINYCDEDGNNCFTAADIATLSGSALPGAPDRGIQFNSGGNFAAEANFTYTSAGDLIVGSYQLDDTGTGSEDNRMFFDVSTGSFRAGSVSGSHWNYTSSGQYSVAMGSDTTASANFGFAMGTGSTASGMAGTALGANTVASGMASVAMGSGPIASGNIATAMGFYTVASGGTATAMGESTEASGLASTAMGHSVIAGSGTAGDGAGDGSFAIGLVDNAVTITTKPKVTGIQSMGIFMGDQDGGVVFASSSTLGLFGGRMVIDPNVPATNLAADVALDVTGAIKLDYDATACSATIEGAIRYDSGGTALNYCDGSTWQTIANGGSTGLWTDNTTHISYQSAHIIKTGETMTSAGFDGLTTKGMIWHTDKQALRAGSAVGYNTRWNEASIGTLSAAFGNRNRAASNYSFAAGDNNLVVGSSSAAFGTDNTTSGNYNFAAGWNNDTFYDASVALGIDNVAGSSTHNGYAFGKGNIADGYNMAIGRYVSATGNGSVAIGATYSTATRPIVSGADSIGIFMGDQSGVNLTQANTMAIMGGKVGVGMVNPSVELDVTGDIEYTGTITDVSDRRLKTDITPLDRAAMVERLMQVDTYSFRMKSDKKGQIEYGVMAQELEQIFPELVRTADDEMGTKSVNYVGLIAPMIETTKDLKAENDTLRTEIAQIKAEQHAALEDLRRDVAGLKAHTGYGISKAEIGLLMLLGIMLGSLGSLIITRRKT